MSAIENRGATESGTIRRASDQFWNANPPS